LSTKILNYIAFCAVVPKVCYAEEIRDKFPGDLWTHYVTESLKFGVSLKIIAEFL